jgi:hypothetical protein
LVVLTGNSKNLHKDTSILEEEAPVGEPLPQSRPSTVHTSASGWLDVEPRVTALRSSQGCWCLPGMLCEDHCIGSPTRCESRWPWLRDHSKSASDYKNKSIQASLPSRQCLGLTLSSFFLPLFSSCCILMMIRL